MTSESGDFVLLAERVGAPMRSVKGSTSRAMTPSHPIVLNETTVVRLVDMCSPPNDQRLSASAGRQHKNQMTNLKINNDGGFHQTPRPPASTIRKTNAPCRIAPHGSPELTDA